MTTLAAYYYPASKAEKARGLTSYYELHRIDGPGRMTQLFSARVSGKAEARELAALDNAKPWNF